MLAAAHRTSVHADAGVLVQDAEGSPLTLLG